MEMSRIAATKTKTPDIGVEVGKAAKNEKPADSFEKLLKSIAAKDNANEPPVKEPVRQTNKKSWREIETGRFAENLGVNRNEAELDTRLQDLLEKLEQLAGGKNVNMEDLLGLLAELKQQLQKIAEESGQEIAGQQLAMFFTKMPLQDVLQKVSGELPQPPQAVQELIAQIGQPGVFEVVQPEQLLQMVMETKPEELAVAFKALLSPEGKSNHPIEQAVQQMPERAIEQVPEQILPQGTNPLDKKPDIKVVSPEAKEADTQPVAAKAQAEHEFSTNVRAAKQGLEQQAGKNGQGEKKDAGIDALQKQVDSGAFLRGTAFEVVKPAQNETPQVYAPLQAQLEEGLMAGIKAGDEQFMIRLMPEGLGEVTVQLTKTPEGMLLNIAAKNSETQKLLSQELGALRENLRTMNVEIKAITSEQPAEMMFHQQNFNGQQQHHRWQDFNGPAYYGDEPLGAQATAEEAEQPPANPLNQVLYTGTGGLNAYI